MQIEEPVGTCHTIEARRALSGARARTMAAFDIAPHNVGNGHALVDDRHPWIYCDERMQRRSVAQLGPSTCKGYDFRGDQPMGPVSRTEARSDAANEAAIRMAYQVAVDKDVAGRANCFTTEGHSRMNRSRSRIAARNSGSPSKCDHSTAIHRARSSWHHSACSQRRPVIDVPAH
jgi:hypothetical protein